MKEKVVFLRANREREGKKEKRGKNKREKKDLEKTNLKVRFRFINV